MPRHYNGGMIELTEAQRRELRRMRGYRVVALLNAGAVLVACDGQFHNAIVIDTDGNIYSLPRYRAVLDQRK